MRNLELSFAPVYYIFTYCLVTHFSYSIYSCLINTRLILSYHEILIKKEFIQGLSANIVPKWGYFKCTSEYLFCTFYCSFTSVIRTVDYSRITLPYDVWTPLICWEVCLKSILKRFEYPRGFNKWVLTSYRESKYLDPHRLKSSRENFTLDVYYTRVHM